MSDFDLPEPTPAVKSASSDFSLPTGLEPNVADINNAGKSKKWIWIVAIALLLIICCCCVIVVAFVSSESTDINNIINEFSMLSPLFVM
jgi:Ni,Fe-hydrogenase I small subunit